MIRMKNFAEYLVDDLMQKNICYVQESVTLPAALQLMEAKHVSSLIVEKTHPHDAYGIITRKDVVIESAENWEGLSHLTVADLMTKPLITIPTNLGIKHAVRLMRLSGVRRLGVLQGEQLAGVLSNADIFRLVLQLMVPAKKTP